MNNRKILNPILFASGYLTTISGILLLFHIGSHLIMITHELIGMIFVVAAIWHIKLNWKAMVNSLSGKMKRWVVLGVISIIVMVISFIIAPPIREGFHGNPYIETNAREGVHSNWIK